MNRTSITTGRIVCRLCTKSDEYFVNIFISNESCEIVVEEAIQDLLGLHVAAGDGLPNAVCRLCLRKLIEFKEFKKICFQSAAELRAYALGSDLTGLKEEVEEPKEVTGEGNSLGEISALNHVRVTEVILPMAEELEMGSLCHVEDDSRPTELVVKEEISDRVDFSEGNIPVTFLSSVNVDPLAVDTTCPVKVEGVPVQLMDGGGMCSVNVEEESPVPNLACDPLAFDNLLLDGEGGRKRNNPVEFETQLPVVVDNSLDPLGLENQTDKVEVYPRDPLGVSDDCDEEGIAEKTCNVDAAVCSELKQFMVGDKGDVKRELELTEMVVKGDSLSDQIVDEGDSSVTGCPVLLSDPPAAGNMVDKFNYIIGIKEEPADNYDNFVNERQEISQNKLHHNTSCDYMRAGDMQSEYSIAKSFSINSFPEKMEGKKKRNIEPYASIKKSSQMAEKAKPVKDHECKQLCHQAASTSHSTEYICDYCNKRYSKIYSLALHIQGHVDGKKCAIIRSQKRLPPTASTYPSVKYCRDVDPVILVRSNTSFSQENPINKNGKLTVKESFGCEKFGSEFIASTALLSPGVTRCDKMTFGCDVCGREFLEKSDLVKHVDIHTGCSPFYCFFCGKKFKLKGGLKRHQALHNGVNRLNCDVCGKEISSKRRMQNHLRTHTDSKQCKCALCGKSFKYISDLNRHAAIHTGVKPFKCSVCGKTFSVRGNLKQHSIIHTGVKPFKCNLCGKLFTQSGGLKRHSVIHSGIKPFKCIVCDKKFNEKGSLKKHSIIHTGVKQFKCDVCGKTFTQRSNLMSHSGIHTGVKPFKCDVCGKTFSVRGNLKQHSFIHTGVKPFKCDVCGKMFTKRGNLKDHSVIHTGVKPFQCNVCGKMFTERGNLNKHSFIHTGVKPFKCNVCEKMFTEKGSLKRHLVVHTGM